MLNHDDPGGALFADIGQRIRAMRRAQNLTQQNLAHAVGLSRTSVANIEAGRQRLPIDLLYDIADVLHVQAVSLLPSNEYV